MIKKPRLSMAFYISALFTCASIAVLFLLESLISGALAEHFVEQDKAFLNNELAQVERVLQSARSKEELQNTVAWLTHKNGRLLEQSAVLLVVRYQNEFLANPEEAQLPLGAFEKIDQETNTQAHFLMWRDSAGRQLSGMANTAMTISGAPLLLTAVMDSSHHAFFIAHFRQRLWVFMAFSALLMGVLSFAIVRRGLAPLRTIQEKTQQMTAQKLNKRLNPENAPQELLPLVRAFNTMLANLEDSFLRLSDFSSDLAHELRTPVSNLRLETEVTLAKTRSCEEYKSVLEANLLEFTRLSRMISDMLLIANADNKSLLSTVEDVDLLKTINNLVEFFSIAAEEKNIALCFVENKNIPPIKGDALMMRRAISNLLNNALQHTVAHATPQGKINIFIENNIETKSVDIMVENCGEPIAAEHLPRLFDRFYRVNPARQSDGTNSGLGLAIVKSIMQAHEGQVFVETSAHTNRFTLRFPVFES